MKRLLVDTTLDMDTRAPEAFQLRVRRLADAVVAEMGYLSYRRSGHCASCGSVDPSSGTHPTTCRMAKALLEIGLAREVDVEIP